MQDINNLNFDPMENEENLLENDLNKEIDINLGKTDTKNTNNKNNKDMI